MQDQGLGSIQITTDGALNDHMKAVMTHPSGSSCEVYLQGAHATSWKTPDGKEQLFTSSQAVYKDGTAIRGGIPVCWPQFGGLGPLAKHGFARLSRDFEPIEMRGLASGASATGEEGPSLASPDPKLVLRLEGSAVDKDWPHSFCLDISFELSEWSLKVGMTVHNQNDGGEQLSFTGALHTYLR